MTVTLAVDHDLCDHCKQKIQTELRELEDLEYFDVDKETNSVEVEGERSIDNVLTAIERAGFAATVQND